jgi:hypothetical protein
MPPFAVRRSPVSGATRLASRLALALGVLALAGCGLVSTSPPAPTPADFQGIATALAGRGIAIDHVVSGEAGCDDIDLARTAIALDASGLDQVSRTRIYLYIFRNRAAFDRHRPEVDACVRAYVTDPQAFESVEASPFVVTGAGPWAPEFHSAVRAAIVAAAGTGD